MLGWLGPIAPLLKALALQRSAVVAVALRLPSLGAAPHPHSFQLASAALLFLVVVCLAHDIHVRIASRSQEAK
eukprot:m.75768 g.75768  ORF g.75768 m.75768 type:complete len:73 (+) comp12459_c2_seq4:652-870(+)